MAYRVNLNCADRVRYAEVSAMLGLDGDKLIKTLLHDFFAMRGVKNPARRSHTQRKFQNAQKV